MSNLTPLYAELASLEERLPALRLANADGRIPHRAVGICEYLIDQLRRHIETLERQAAT